MINLDHLCFYYQQLKVIDDMTLTIDSGDFLCIIGENGAGKTTLVKSILGLAKPTSGTISFQNGLKQNQIGYLPQQSEIQKDFPASVFEIVLSGRLNQKKHTFLYTKDDKQKALETLEKLNIKELKNKSYQELSGGQQQRVLLARALLATTKLLVLDEPTASLDPNASLEFYQLLKRINHDEHITIIMVSHDVSEVSEYASHILLMKQQSYHLLTIDQYVNQKGEF